MTKQSPYPPPDGWGDDPLTEFIEIARGNSFACFVQFPHEYQKAVALDRLFLDLITGWTDPHEPVAATLIIRSHAAFRAALQLALAGQVPEAIALCRASLENALYACHIAKEQGAADAWMDRQKGEKERKRCRDAFGMSRVWDSAKKVEPGLIAAAKRLYEQSIDQGAHPNVHGVFGTVSIHETDDGAVVESAYIAGDELTLKYGLRTCAQIAVACLGFASGLFPARAAQAGIPRRLSALAQGL